VLDPALVERVAVALEQPVDTGLGLRLAAFAVPGKVALHQETGDVEIGRETNETIGLQVSGAGTSFFYVPACAAVTPALLDRLRGADLVFFDGTTYDDDEMVRLGLSEKTARRMGHVAMDGPEGSLARFAGLPVGRKIYIHVNNSNPVLVEGSAERRAIEAAGWELAFDGMEVVL
jgi:pyrroloquinoline quinone biosynthesis protein B